jgi:hypothetical protein
VIKLLVIAPQNPYPAIDGGKAGIYYPVIHFAKAFEVHFAFITSQNVAPGVYEHFKEQNVSIYPLVLNTEDKALGYFYNFTNILPYKFQKYCTRSILKKLERICENEGINHIWCNHAHVAWYGLQLKRIRGANIFLREHNIEYSLVKQVMQVQKNPFIKAFVKYQYLKTRNFELKCWATFSKTFFISDLEFDLANQIQKQNNFVLLYDSFSGKALENRNNQGRSKIDREPFCFIFTASIDSFQNGYNLQKFIKEIWQPLIRNNNKWKLYITGNKQKALEDKLKINLIDNNIINLGFVDDIESVVASKKYFISPTYIGSGLRIKVLDALSGGSVCFVTLKDLKMLKILKDGDNIVKFEDYDEFYSKLLRLEANDILYSQISVNALQVGTTFSWSKYVDTVYNEVAKVENFTSR